MGRRRPLAWLIIAAMAIGSIAMWLGVPVGWILVVSKVVSSQKPGMGTYVVLIVGIPATMFAVGKGLSALNRLYGRVTGTEPTLPARSPAPWMRSMRDERDAGSPRTVLDVVMIWSVAVAVVCFGAWFFFAAGSSI